MGMSTNVVGFCPPSDQWKKYKKVWDACIEAGLNVPDEVSKYFNHEPPDDLGVTYSEQDLRACGAVRAYSKDGSDGFEVHLDKLPKTVKVLRFYNSW